MKERTSAMHVKHADQYTHEDLYQDVCAFERALIGYLRATRAAASTRLEDRELKLGGFFHRSTNTQRDRSDD